MSIFKKILATVGIGSAKVDTCLERSRVYPGDILEGNVRLEGGDLEQQINDIYLFVVTQYKQEIDDSTVTREYELIKHRLCESFLLQPGQQKVFEFSLKVPYETPLTLHRQIVYLRTGLDISLAFDPTDKDSLEIIPHPLMQLVFNALERLGFRLKEVSCEYHRSYNNPIPFIQEFEFYPTGKYHSHLDELEVVFQLAEERLTVCLEIDRKVKGIKSFFAEALDADESHVSFPVNSMDLNIPLESFTHRLDQFIERYI